MKKFSFTKNTKIFFGIVILMVIVGVASFFIRGFNLDIDFVGGTEIAYDVKTPIDHAGEGEIVDLVKNALTDAGLDASKFSSVRVSGDEKNVITIRTLVSNNDSDSAAVTEAIKTEVAALFADAAFDADKSNDTTVVFTKPAAEGEEAANWTEEEITAVSDALEAALADNQPAANASGNELQVSFESNSDVSTMRAAITDAICGKFEGAEWVSTNTVSASVSEGLKKSAIIATALAVVLMLIYIAFRFQISSAFAAVVCLIHDLFIMLVAYSIFQIPVNSNIIAALLTILGYSINATIIIFDRIRENEAKMGSGVPFAEKVDDGIRATITRSLNTTLTTLFTIGMIYILGVESIKNFALPLIVGIIAGLFSSVCLAGPVWNLFKKVGKKK